MKSYVVGRRAFARAGRTTDGEHFLAHCFAGADCLTQPQLDWDRSEQLLCCGAQGAGPRHRSSSYRCLLWPFIRWVVDHGLSILIYPFRDFGPLILGAIFSLILLRSSQTVCSNSYNSLVPWHSDTYVSICEPTTQSCSVNTCLFLLSLRSWRLIVICPSRSVKRDVRMQG